MLLWCPSCGERHLDVGAFATKVHHTHACQSCGMVWRPAIVATVGVAFLPGFKNDAEVESKPSQALKDTDPQFCAADLAMHVLWTWAVGLPGYDKKKWIELEAAILALARR